MIKKILFLTGFYLAAIMNLTAQLSDKAQFQNIDFTYNSESIAIIYDLTNTAPIERYDVTPVIHFKSGKTIAPIAFTGDMFNITGGVQKIIIWNYKKDFNSIEDSIYVELTLIRKHTQYPMYIKYSAIFPGYGNYKITKNFKWLSLGVAGYGLLATSVFCGISSVNNYGSYKTNFDIAQSKTYFHKAVLQRGIALGSIIGAAAVWATDLVLTSKKSEKYKNEMRLAESKIQYSPVFSKTKFVKTGSKDTYLKPNTTTKEIAAIKASVESCNLSDPIEVTAEISEAYLKDKIIIKKKFYEKKEIDSLKKQIASCKNGIEAQIDQYTDEINAISSLKQDIMKSKDIKKINEQISEKEKTIETIKSQIQTELLTVSYKGLYICVIKDFDRLTESKTDLANKAASFIKPKAVEEINGTFIQSLTDYYKNEKEESFFKHIKSTISGEVTPDKVYLSTFRGDFFIYLTKVSVAPLKKR